MTGVEGLRSKVIKLSGIDEAELPHTNKEAMKLTKQELSAMLLKLYSALKSVSYEDERIAYREAKRTAMGKENEDLKRKLSEAHATYNEIYRANVLLAKKSEEGQSVKDIRAELQEKTNELDDARKENQTLVNQVRGLQEEFNKMRASRNELLIHLDDNLPKPKRKAGRPVKYGEEDRAEICKLYIEGHSIRKIAAMKGINPGTVQKIVKALKNGAAE